MNKKVLSLLLLLGTIVPLSSLAFKTDGGDNLNLTTPVVGDYYIAGGIINLNTNVDGDAVIAGAKIIVDGNITEDLITMGAEQTINGNIGESARIAGGKIILDGTIKRDLLVMGAEITIKGNIKGQTNIVGGKIIFEATANNIELNGAEVILKGEINGDATINAQKITIETGAKILGNLNYQSENEILNIKEIVSGEITFKQINKKNIFITMFGDFILLRFTFLLIFGFILLYFGKKRIRPSLETLKEQPLKALGYGALICIGLPIVAMFLAITIIGLPFAFIAITSFITIMIFAKLLNVYFYTNFLIERFGGYDKLNNLKQIGILLACVILSTLMSGIDLIFTFFALGAIVRTYIIKNK